MDEHLSDLPAERCVLAGLFNYGISAYIEIAELLSATTFTDTVNQAFYKTLYYLIVEQNVEHPDKSSLISAASTLGLGFIFENKDDLQHVRSIINSEVKLENVVNWAAKIRKLEITRLLKKQLREANYDLDKIKGIEPIDSIIGIAEKAVFDFSEILLNANDEKPVLLGQDVDKWLDHVEEHPVDIIGISSGYNIYDLAIGGGFRRKTVSLIGSRQKVGKSLLSINVGLFAASKLKIPTLYLDTEMNELDHYPRCLSHLCYDNGCKITINDIECGKYSKIEKKRTEVRRASDYLRSIPFFYKNISGKSFEHVMPIMRRWIHQHVGYADNGQTKPCLIIYDYVKLMKSDDLGDGLKEYQALGFLMTSMHNFTVKNDIPILGFVQLNRDGINSEETDTIAGSDRIGWLTTNYSIFKTKSPDEIATDGPENGNRKLVVVSSRHGSGLKEGDYINFNFVGEYAKIIQLRTRFQVRDDKQGNNNINGATQSD